MDHVYAACQEVSAAPTSSPTPLFNSTDFTPLSCLKRNRPLPVSPQERTVFKCGDDWISDSANTVLGMVHASVCPPADNENKNESTSPLSLRRSSASVEVDSSAADLFTPLIQPFSRQIRLLQCTSCRRPLLPTRLFQHMSHCPAKNDGMSAELMSLRDDPSLDLIAASYISPISSPAVRKRPRASFVSKNVSKSRPTQSDGSDMLRSPNDHLFAPPKEEDDWRFSLTPLAPPFKPVSKYRRRRVFLPPPQEPPQRKRVSSVEKRALNAAALTSIHSIPTRSSSHQQKVVNSKDPLRNIVSKNASNFPWIKLIQIALPLCAPRNPSRRKMTKDVRLRNSASILQSNPSSPPTTPKLSSPAGDAADIESLATNSTTPSLVGALLYLRGQGLPQLAHTPLASLDPPQHSLSRSGPFYHGQTYIAPVGTYWTDVRPPNDSKFSFPTIETVTTTSTVAQPSVSHPPRPVPVDPRTKKFVHPVNQTIPPNPVSSSSQPPRPVVKNDVPAVANQGIRQTTTALLNGSVNANAQSSINAPVDVRMMPQASLNPALNPGPQIAANVIKGAPPSLDTDGTMSQHSSYAVSPSLPPLSPSIKRQRPGKSRMPVASAAALSSGLAVTNKPGLPASRKSSGLRTSSGVKSTQHRLQSPVTSNMVQTPPAEPANGMLLTPTDAIPSAFTPNAIPQSKKPFRSPGVMPRPPSTAPLEISGQQIGGISGASKPMLVTAKAGRSGKGRQHTSVGANLSSGKSTAPLVKTAVKNQSPSQGSVCSGDLSSLHTGTGVASKGYDPMILAASLASNGIGGKHIPTSHVESSNQPLEFHQQVLSHVAQPAGKASIRNDPAVDLQGMISSMRGNIPAFASDGSLNHFQRNVMPPHAPSSRPSESPLLAGPGARAQTSAGLKNMNAVENQRHGNNRGENMKAKTDELDTQLPQTGAMHVDRPGFKEKLSNVATKSLPNTANYMKRLDRNMMSHVPPTQGYYSSVLASTPNQTSPISAAALKGQPNLTMFGLGPSGQQNAVMGPNVAGAVGVLPNNTNAPVNVFQGMPDMRALHGIRMHGGGNNLQQSAQHNVLRFFPGNGLNTGVSNNLLNAGGMFNALGGNGLIGSGGSNNDVANGNGNGSAADGINNSGVNSNLNGSAVGGGQASEALTADALLQQMLAGHSGMGSEIGGATSVGLGGISLTNGLQSSGHPNGPHNPGTALHGGNMGGAGLSLNHLGLGRAGGGFQSAHGILPFGGAGLGDEPQHEMKFNFQESDLL